MYLSFHLYILNTHQIEDYVYDSTSKKGLLQFIMLVMIHFYLSNRRDEIILENKVAENQRNFVPTSKCQKFEHVFWSNYTVCT